MEDPYKVSNASVDLRHEMPSGVAEPRQENGKLEVLRCFEGCWSLWTEFELQRYGMCPHCKAMKFNRGFPKRGPFGLWSLEKLRLVFYDVTKNWRVHGPNGKGWDNGSPISLKRK